MAEEDTITLQSQEGRKLRVDKAKFEISGLIKNILEEEDDDDSEDGCIPLPNVKYDVLQDIARFADIYHISPMPKIKKPIRGKIQDILPNEYAEYIEGMDNERIHEIIMASDYMDITPLLELACAKIATTIKGSSVKHIMQLFDMHGDFTQEEHEKIEGEIAWIET